GHILADERRLFGLAADQPDRRVHAGDAGAAARGQYREPVARARRGDRLDAGRPRPALALDAEHLDLGVGDQALVDGLDRVRAVPSEADRAVAAYRELHAGAPADAVGGARDLLDDDIAFDAGQAAELLLDHRGLQPALRRKRHVLPVAPAAPPGP